MRDKDYRTMLRRLSVFGGTIIFPGIDNQRQLKNGILKNYAQKTGNFKKIFISENVNRALRLAEQNKKNNELIVICGSLYLAGEFKKLLIKD
jgi:Folylpolyglutamate synthase